MKLPDEQTIHLHNRAHRPMPAQPITHGVPWPRGVIQPGDAFVATGGDGTPIPAGFRTLNTWDDGSVQWTLVDLCVDLAESQDLGVTIARAVEAGPTPANPVHAEIEGDMATIGNGRVSLRVSAKPGELIQQWRAGGGDLVEPEGFDITFTSDGKAYSLKAGPRRMRIEHANGVRAVLRLDGKHGVANGKGDPLLDYYLRIEVCADRDDVKITHGFRNREEPTPGISISDFRAVFPTTLPADATRCYTANTRTRHYLTEPMRVPETPQIVASDTGDLDNYASTHKAGANADVFVRNPEVLHDPVEDKPWWLRDIKFRLQAGGSKCVWPYLAAMGEGGGAVACLEKMSSLHPKELTLDGATFVVKLYPEWAGDLSITQGAGRSHTMYLAPLSADASDIDIQNVYLSWEFGGIHTHIPSALPIEVSPDLDHMRDCQVFAIDKLPRYEPESRFFFERKVLDAWIGISYGQLGAVDQVAQWPASGFWDYGDNGRGNNEEMNALVYFQNYLRTGNFGCFEKALNGTAHMLEVDHCAYSVDEYQSGGQVAHTVNHNDGTAYPSHMWFTEYLFAYAITGDEEFLEGAKRVCENLLFWINDEMGFRIIAADQREAGQPMINLTWCYHFVKDQRYLDGCWKIVRDYLMANTEKYGRMLDGKPFSDPVKVCSYGDYAAWEGMYWLWEITRDEDLKRFMLGQLEWRLQWKYMGVHGFHRVTDYNPAAYAWYMTGDSSWLTRVAKPFKGAFRAANWPIGWVHAMYYVKLAFDHGLIEDDDITVR